MDADNAVDDHAFFVFGVIRISAGWTALNCLCFVGLMESRGGKRMR